MEVEILEQTPKDGLISLKLKVSNDDVSKAMKASKASLALERGVSQDELDELVPAADFTNYAKEYALSKAVNIAAAKLGENLSAPSQIYYEQDKQQDDCHIFTCDIYPQPKVWLDSYEPINISGKRIPAPGVSMEAAKNGDKDVEYIDDDTVLMIELPKRLRGNIPEAYIERLVKDFGAKFEQQLALQGTSIDQYCEQMGMDEKEFSSLMTMEVRKKLPTDLALDALFEGLELELTQDDIDETLQQIHPNNTQEFKKSYEDHGDLYIIEQQARRKKAHQWVKATFIS